MSKTETGGKDAGKRDDEDSDERVSREARDDVHKQERREGVGIGLSEVQASNVQCFVDKKQRGIMEKYGQSARIASVVQSRNIREKSQ